MPVGVTSARISFQVYILNNGSGYVSPSSLDKNVSPNQQLRVDIITTSADPFSVAGGDVLQNFYQTQPGFPNNFGSYSSSTDDLTGFLQAHEGETLRLRIAETDNQGNFRAGVDNVSLSVNGGLGGGGGASAPEPATGLLAFAILPAAGLIARRKRA